MQKYFRERDRGYILLLFVAVCLIYLPFLGNPFFFDDLSFFKKGTAAQYAHSVFKFDFRWFSYASLGWTYRLSSDVDTHFYHLGNMLLHYSNAILLFYVLRQLVGAVISEQDNSPALISGAWIGALVFACHPVAVYAVGYVIERSIVMATLFALVMQFAYMKGMLGGQKRWLVLSVVAFFLAGYSKEQSVMMPAILAGQTILLWSKNRIGYTALGLTWGALLGVALLLVMTARGILGTAYEPLASVIFDYQGMDVSPAMLHLLSVLTQAGLFFKYLFLWLFPNPAWMSVDMREHFISSLGEWQGWIGGIAFIAYGVLSIGLLLRSRWLGLLGFALLYPWMQFMVELTVVRMQEPFVLYRSYLWMPGLMVFFPWLVINFPKRRTMLTLAIIVVAMPLSWNRLWVFSDEYRLWNEAVVKLPSLQAVGADRALFNRAEASGAKGNWRDAADDFEKAVALRPTFPQMHKELGIVYAHLGRYHDAIKQLDEAIALKPDFAAAYYYKGMALKLLHKDDLAMPQMVKGCELGYPMACVITRFRPKPKMNE